MIVNVERNADGLGMRSNVRYVRFHATLTFCL